MPEPLPAEPAEPPTPQLDDDAALLDFVATRDMACPACGYNLRMLNTPSCPECGLPLKLTVGSDEPFKRAWAIALCLNAMIAGVGLFFILISVASGDSPLYYEHYAWLWFLGPIIWMPLPIILFFLRRRFCRLAPGTQYLAIAITIFAGMIFTIALFTDF